MNRIGRKRSASGGVLPGGEALPRGAVKWGEGLFAAVPLSNGGMFPVRKLHAGDCECPDCCAQWRSAAESAIEDKQRFSEALYEAVQALRVAERSAEAWRVQAAPHREYATTENPEYAAATMFDDTIKNAIAKACEAFR